MAGVIVRALCLLAALTCAGASADTLSLPPRPQTLAVTPAPRVKDPVLAYLIALLEADLCDTLTGSDIRAASVKPGRSTLIPLHLLDAVGRGPSLGDTGRVVTLWLTKPGKVPAPYSLLGYHPGSVCLPKRVVLREWRLGMIVLSDPRRGSFTLRDCYVWAVIEGRVWIDIDAFVDKFLGRAVDDVTVTSLALFWWNDVRYAMSMGYNDRREGRSGALSLPKNELEFPSPWQLRAAGKFLRGKTEALLRQTAVVEAPPTR